MNPESYCIISDLHCNATIYIYGRFLGDHLIIHDAKQIEGNLTFNRISKYRTIKYNYFEGTLITQDDVQIERRKGLLLWSVPRMMAAA